MKFPVKSIIILSITVFISLIVWASSSKERINQPIEYNHKVHIEVAELECTDCHLYVEGHAKATIPNIDICQDCHSDDPLTDSPEEQKLLQYISNDEQIPWVQIYTVPNHVYFSHRRHVTIGQLKCSECHGDVLELTSPAPYQLVQISMNNCLECHDKHDVKNDCISCHY